VILIVEAVTRFELCKMQQVRSCGQHFGRYQYRCIGLGTFEVETEELFELVHLGAQLAVELVAAHAAEVVATALEESIAEVGTSGLDGWRFAGANALVDL